MTASLELERSKVISSPEHICGMSASHRPAYQRLLANIFLSGFEERGDQRVLKARAASEYAGAQCFLHQVPRHPSGVQAVRAKVSGSR